MNKILGVVALVAIQALATTARSPCVCARNYRPVCGSDGHTYSNECTLNCEIYKGKSDLTVASEGPCKGDELPTCICNMIDEPVCGNDGNTYPNKCAMLCTRATNPNIALAHEGKCEDKVKVATPLCICTFELNEVCGSDGKTYGNPCELNCATANDNTLRIQHPGKCDDVNVVDNAPKPPPCTCARDFKPVCGSDGVTYTNDCLLNCATANDNTLRIQHPGKCDDVNVVDNAPKPPPCTCARDFKPVCGSDGVTYTNDCLLNCATANDNTLRIQHPGKCNDVNVVDNAPKPPPCTCARDFKPVCGSDGVTYTNDCLLNCETANDNTLRIQHPGKCDDVNVVDNAPKPPPCTCARDFKPVCGSDGVTYANDCLLNCATANNSALRIQHSGKCADSTGQSCTCTRDMEPVCGADGVTYNNSCLLECAGQTMAKHGPC